MKVPDTHFLPFKHVTVRIGCNLSITLKKIGRNRYVYIEYYIRGRKRTVYCGKADKAESWRKAYGIKASLLIDKKAMIEHELDVIKRFLSDKPAELN